MTPKELENIMVAKQAAESFMNQWEIAAEYLKVMAKLRRQYYLVCVAEGFTAQEALYLSSAFQLPTSSGSN